MPTLPPIPPLYGMIQARIAGEPFDRFPRCPLCDCRMSSWSAVGQAGGVTYWRVGYACGAQPEAGEVPCRVDYGRKLTAEEYAAVLARLEAGGCGL